LRWAAKGRKAKPARIKKKYDFAGEVRRDKQENKELRKQGLPPLEGGFLTEWGHGLFNLESHGDITHREVVAKLDVANRPPRSVAAAVSRALSRLAKRGLLEWAWHGGWKLTDAGVAEAEKLSVNKSRRRSKLTDRANG
jgi:hypothetical protein